MVGMQDMLEACCGAARKTSSQILQRAVLQRRAAPSVPQPRLQQAWVKSVYLIIIWGNTRQEQRSCNLSLASQTPDKLAFSL